MLAMTFLALIALLPPFAARRRAAVPVAARLRRRKAR
jgi:hypothetical protein